MPRTAANPRPIAGIPSDAERSTLTTALDKEEIRLGCGSWAKSETPNVSDRASPSHRGLHDPSLSWIRWISQGPFSSKKPYHPTNMDAARFGVGVFWGHLATLSIRPSGREMRQLSRAVVTPPSMTALEQRRAEVMVRSKYIAVPEDVSAASPP
ncbi:MAG: hypothetical protein V3V08_12885 [Nannocystaceae bacterium]